MIRAAVALFTVAVVSCSLVVDANSLNEGCPSTMKLCDGKCVEKSPDVGCGGPSCLPCFLRNATPLCSGAGECVIGACNPGFDSCDNDSGNGCETDKRQDNNHCGMCGRRCAPLNAEPDCANQTCDYLSCNPGFADCDEDGRNGCEASLSDEATCGACNIACTPAQTCGGPSGAKVCLD